MKNYMKIILRNHRCQLVGKVRDVLKLREDKRFRIRVQNAYWAMQSTNGWDGYKRFITNNGTFDTGLLPEILSYLEENKFRVEISDKRDLFKEMGQTHELGDMIARDYQAEAVKVLLENKLHNLRFQRGILYEATNAGKNFIAASLFDSFSKKRKGLFLINSKIIFNQAVEEITDLLGSDEVGYCSSDMGTKWKRFNICMVQTLSNRIKTDNKIRKDVSECSILLVDEADEVIGYKTCKHIMQTAWNAPVRVALTGTADTSKDKIKNKELVAFFGPIIHTVTNKELVEKGHSAKPLIKIHEGNTRIKLHSYADEYKYGIMRSKERNDKVWKRVKYHLKKGRTSILILYKYHYHLKRLIQSMPKKIEERYRVEGVHGKYKNREAILTRFKNGEIDILICSMIIKRGKNIPLVEALINAAGGDSHTNLKQIFGRGLRKKEGVKEKIHFDDFYDKGNYLQRHSKHRVIYYKKEGFPVKELYKK